MKNILIAIPTFNHPQYIKYYLNSILECAQECDVDIMIMDSSDNEDTKHVVEKKQKSGYDNLLYKRYASETLYTTKAMDALLISGYKYIWLCGDGLVINLERCYEQIIKEINNDRDVIVIDSKAREEEEFDNALSFFNKCFRPVTHWGETIVKSGLFEEQDLRLYEKKYRDWCYPYAIFSKCGMLSNLNIIKVCIDFWTPNPYKKTSTWISDCQTIRIFSKTIVDMIDGLPDVYNTQKKAVLNAFLIQSNIYKNIKLVKWRANGNLNISVVYINIAYLIRILGFRIFYIIFISLLPKRFAKTISIVYEGTYGF